MNRTINLLEYAFLLLYILRSFTDILFKDLLFIASVRISLSFLMAIAMIGIATLYLFLLYIKNELHIDKMGWIFLGWVLFLGPWVIIAAFNFGVSGLTAGREWIRLISLVLFFATVYQITTRKGPDIIINSTILALTIPLATSYYQLIFQMVGKNSTLDRTYGTMTHSSSFSFVMVIMIGLTFWKASQAGGKNKIFWILLLILTIPALITSSVLGGWIMAFTFLFSIALLTKNRKVKASLGILTVGLVVLLIVGSFLFSDVSLQFEELWKLEGNPRGRIEKWDIYFNNWLKKPISGYGLNTSNFVWPTINYHANKSMTYPHNDYLRYLVECGVFGLIGFVSFLILGFRRLKNLLTQTTNPSQNKLMIVALGLFLGWSVISLSDNVITMTVFQVYFWGTIAAAVGSVKHKNKTLEHN